MSASTTALIERIERQGRSINCLQTSIDSHRRGTFRWWQLQQKGSRVSLAINEDRRVRAQDKLANPDPKVQMEAQAELRRVRDDRGLEHTLLCAITRHLSSMEPMSPNDSRRARSPPPGPRTFTWSRDKDMWASNALIQYDVIADDKLTAFCPILHRPTGHVMVVPLVPPSAYPVFTSDLTALLPSHLTAPPPRQHKCENALPLDPHIATLFAHYAVSIVPDPTAALPTYRTIVMDPRLFDESDTLPSWLHLPRKPCKFKAIHGRPLHFQNGKRPDETALAVHYELSKLKMRSVAESTLEGETEEYELERARIRRWLDGVDAANMGWERVLPLGTNLVQSMEGDWAMWQTGDFGDAGPVRARGRIEDGPLPVQDSEHPSGTAPETSSVESRTAHAEDGHDKHLIPLLVIATMVRAHAASYDRKQLEEHVWAREHDIIRPRNPSSREAGRDRRMLQLPVWVSAE
ncbi:MAG: hypothetical protein M1814_001169 [Vezdaea aestivalis]|nr:MAG: hypothetical protein M1814_001169 [Vezdaea aestivalis]